MSTQRRVCFSRIECVTYVPRPPFKSNACSSNFEIVEDALSQTQKHSTLDKEPLLNHVC